MIYRLREFSKLIRLQSLGVSTPPVVGALTVTGAALHVADFIVLFFIGFLSQVLGSFSTTWPTWSWINPPTICRNAPS